MGCPFSGHTMNGIVVWRGKIIFGKGTTPTVKRKFTPFVSYFSTQSIAAMPWETILMVQCYTDSVVQSSSGRNSFLDQLTSLLFSCGYRASNCVQDKVWYCQETQLDQEGPGRNIIILVLIFYSYLLFQVSNFKHKTLTSITHAVAECRRQYLGRRHPF